MKKNCALAFAVFFLSFPANAQTYLCCDFSGGIPDNFNLIDNDQLSPSADMQKVGFAVGTPWLVMNPTGETNPAACSTSWYSPSGQSDDWLITPPLTLGPDVCLYWRAKASDKKYRDGYSVYVSETASTAIADFDTAHPLFTVDAEENAWVSHSVSLDAYEGKTVTLAFVNQSVNMSRLFVDDIVVARQTTVALHPVTAEKTAQVGGVTLQAVVYPTGSDAIEGFTAGYTIGNETYSQQFDQTVAPGQEMSITLDRPVDIADRQRVDFTLWVETAGSRYEENRSLTSYQRKVLIEECTGTWCTWCVRGIVMMEKLNAEASDRFVGIAVHDNDVMESDYTTELHKRWPWSGLPNGVIARGGMADPKDFEGMLRSAFNYESVLVSLQLKAAYDRQTGEVRTTTNVRFADDLDGKVYRLAYAVIENNVHHPDDARYYQGNTAYSGGANGEMGGWENKPAMISPEDMWFQEVARGYSGSFDGIEGSIPDDTRGDDDVVYNYDFPLPSNVDDPDEARIIVMLIDADDNHVVNAEIAAMGEAAPSAIAPQRTPAAPAGYYGLDGRRLAVPQKGLNIVKTADGRTVKTMVK